MTFVLHTACTNAIALTIEDLIGDDGTIQIRTGPPPGPTNTAGGVLLCTITVSSWTTTGGVLTSPNLPATLPSAAGIAGHFRIRNLAGTARFEGTVTDLAGTGDIKLASTTLSTTVPVDLGVLSMTMPTTI